MNKRQERFGEFVVTRGNASELLDTGKEALDQIASAVKMPVEIPWCEAIGSGRNHCLGTCSLDSGHEMIRIVPLVGNDELPRQALDQFRRTVDVGDLSGREDDAQRIAQCIDRNVQFGG
jgi:hypothetical protein